MDLLHNYFKTLIKPWSIPHSLQATSPSPLSFNPCRNKADVHQDSSLYLHEDGGMNSTCLSEQLTGRLQIQPVTPLHLTLKQVKGKITCKVFFVCLFGFFFFLALIPPRLTLFKDMI